MRFHRVLVATLGVALLAFLVSLVPQKNASAAPPNTNVVVVNTPLPISGSVAVTNTPLPVSGSVSASQSGPWSVAVNNLPTTQSVTFSGAQPVSLSNTLSTPLYNSDRDNPARQPVAGACDIPNQIPPSPGAALSSTCTLVVNDQLLSSVPAGQRLVIETVTGVAEVPTGTIPERFNLQTISAPAVINSTLMPQRVGAETATYDVFIVSEQVRLYSDPGSSVQFVVVSNQNQQSISAGVTFAGYLVNLP